jgi:tRNA(Ile)-lysidine synthase
MEWKQRFDTACKHLGIKPGQHLLLAVSGGLDSMSLLQMCRDAGLHISVAHANFKLRGADSDADQALVESRCKVHGISCHTKALPIAKDALRDGLQAEARRLRYAWFEEVMAESGAQHLLTAHHLNDRLETFFIHLMRGAGLKGLASIPKRNRYILRPLLDFTRADLEAYAKSVGLAWREDASNAGDAYLRNRIRRQVIPALMELNPQALQMAARSMNHLSAADAEMEAAAAHFAEAKLQPMTQGMHRLALDALKHLCENSTLAKYFFERMGFGPEGMVVLLTLIDSPSGKMAEGSILNAWRDRDSIVFAPRELETPEPLLISGKEGSMTQPLQLKWRTLTEASTAPTTKAGMALLQADKLQLPLTLRRWQPGDRFVPSGMRGSKKLSDYLTDLKLSIPEKQRVWLLCSGADICWVLGHRVDERYRWKGEGEAFGLTLF